MKNKIQDAIELIIKSGPKTPAELADLKRRIGESLSIPTISNVTLFSAYRQFIKKHQLSPIPELEAILIKKPVRSLSGVINISVLTKPYKCPGQCLYCPGQTGMPKSYLKGEPAAQRAADLKFDPYKQVLQRIKVLDMEGHATDKIELRIIGGNWSSYPTKYKIWFVTECFRACNKTKSEKVSSIKKLQREQRKNETTKHRLVGIAIETRPDTLNTKEINLLLSLGVTKVELGVQSIYDDVLRINHRGHKIKETILATKILKDAGFKVAYQMMPCLYGSSSSRDLQMFKRLFSCQDFQPDSIKIYPLVVVKQSPLYKVWQQKKYLPPTPSQLKKLIKKIKLVLPYYVRVERVIRDIPAQYALNDSGKLTNLRQILHEELKKENLTCRCIRCREVKQNFCANEEILLFRYDYKASGGQETFLSFENKNRTKLFAILRLRISNQAIIRELHTYGKQLPIADKTLAPQHQGLGLKLLAEAESIAKNEFNKSKLLVISGIGARAYYKKFGYSLEEPYMVKKLT